MQEINQAVFKGNLTEYVSGMYLNHLSCTVWAMILHWGFQFSLIS